MLHSTPPPVPGETEEGLSSHLPAFLASFLGYFRARLELAGIESKEAAQLYFKIAVLLIAALILLSFGYAFLWIGIIALVAMVTVHWGWIVLLVALAHLAGVAVSIWGICRLWKKQVFPATLKEFRKDQEWLKRHT